MKRVYSSLKFRVSKVFILVATCLTGLVIISNTNSYYNGFKNKIISRDNQLETNDFINKNHKYKVADYYSRRKNWTTSNLGSIMFKNVNVNTFSARQNKTFNILIWKHYDAIKNRHFFYFGSKMHNPLEECSVSNCIFTGNDNLLNKVDAVVVHLQRGELPPRKYPGQVWVFLNDEAPRNAFSLSKAPPRLSELAGKFNWSMNYRSDSDIPVPYGRTIALPNHRYEEMSYLETIQLIPHWEKKQRDVLITVLMSNCHVPARMKLLNEIKKYTHIDVYGKCAEDPKHKNVCPGHMRAECEFMSYYLFYLVLENSMCKEYMTEKLFYHAYSKGAIPVIYGPPLSDCEDLLPPNSFIHVDSFANVKELAKEIISVSRNEEKLFSYHLWRNDFEVVNEHGYFGSKSYHMCRLCEGLNYNDLNEKVYDEDKIRDYLDPLRTCK